MIAQQLDHILPAPQSLGEAQQGHRRPFVGRCLHAFIKEIAEVVVREFGPFDFHIREFIPMEKMWQAQRKEPFEVFAKFQQFTDSTLDQWHVIGPRNEVAADDQSPIQAEFAVGPDMEGCGIQQIANEHGIGGAIGNEVSRHQRESKVGSYVINRHGADLDEMPASEVRIEDGGFAGFRILQLDRWEIIFRAGFPFEHRDDEFPHDGDERRGFCDGVLGGAWLGHGNGGCLRLEGAGLQAVRSRSWGAWLPLTACGVPTLLVRRAAAQSRFGGMLALSKTTSAEQREVDDGFIQPQRSTMTPAETQAVVAQFQGGK